MDASEYYCVTCGAANALGTVTCFACGKDVLQVRPEDDKTLLNGRYRILAPVGQGGFAKVYKAQDTSTLQTVAIKAISLKSLAPHEIIDATDTYNREIHFGTTLKHVSLPKIHDYFMDQEHWYIVADFVEGQTLEEYMLHLPNRRLPLQDVLSIGVQVCNVLSYLHSCQPPIIFRDVKPDNIMRTAGGHIYLIDFGIARRLCPGRQRDTQPLGSPGYAAPEQYGSAQTTEQSDIYSLGATLRALLTGKNPLDVPAGGEDLAGYAWIPPEVVSLLSRMLEKEPAKRPTSVSAIKHQLKQIEKQTDSVGTKKPAMQPFGSVSPLQMPPVSLVGNATKRSAKYSLWSKAVFTGIVLLVVGMSTGTFGGIFSALRQSTPAKQVFTVGYDSRLPSFRYPTLDPTIAVDTLSIQAGRLLYAGLVQLDDSMNVQPQLASSWQQSADGLTWSFTLRPNLHFSDGTPLTSADVAYSIDHSLDPAVKSATASTYLQYIANATKRMSGKVVTLIGDSILTPTPNTVVIKTARHTGFFLDTLTCLCASVVEKSLIDQYGQNFVDHLDEGGSSGPFKLDGSALDFVANPDYYGATPPITEISFVGYNSESDAYDAYLAGQATTIDVSESQISQTETRSDFHRMTQFGLHYYAMNYLKKPFDNIAIRQAFALALNKGLIAAVRHGAVSASNHIIPMGQAGSNTMPIGPAGVRSVAGDATLAKQLLQKGMQEEGISSIAAFPPVTLTYPDPFPVSTSSLVNADEMHLVQKMWKDGLGVNVQLHPDYLDTTDVAWRNETHDLQFWIDNFAGYPDAPGWTTLQFGPGSAFNTVSYGQNSGTGAVEQQGVQLLMRLADAMPQTPLRTQLYQQIERSLVNDVAWLPISQVEQGYLLQLNVVGYKMNALHVIPAMDWEHISISHS